MYTSKYDQILKHIEQYVFKDTTEARKQINEFKRIADLSNLELKIKITNIEAMVLYMENRAKEGYHLAIQMVEDAKELYNRKGDNDKTLLMLSYNRLALGYSLSGNVIKSIENYLLALNCKDQSSIEIDNENYAKVLNNISYTLIKLELYEQAKVFVEKGLNLDRNTISDSTYGILLNNLGGIFAFTNRYSEAEKILLEAKNILLSKDPDFKINFLLYTYATIFDKLFQPDEAIDKLYEALEEVKKYKEINFIINIYTLLIKQLVKTGRKEEAVNVIEDVENKYSIETISINNAELCLEAATLYEAKGDIDQALLYYETFSKSEYDNRTHFKETFLQNSETKNEIKKILSMNNAEDNDLNYNGNDSILMKKSYNDLLKINKFTQKISIARNKQMIIDEFNTSVKNIIDCDISGIFILDDNKSSYSQHLKVNGSILINKQPIPLEKSETYIATIIKNKKTVVETNLQSSAFESEAILPFMDETGSENIMKSSIATPLIIDDEVLGAICIQSNNIENYNDYHTSIFTILAANISIAIKMVSYIVNANNEVLNQVKIEQDLNTMHKKLVDLSFIDTLTGIYNRRKFIKIAENELQTARRMKSRIGILIIDVDNFKSYNDNYGHLEGDQCLKQVANTLVESSDNNDCVARYSGDEFIMLVSGDSSDQMTEKAKRIIKNMWSKNIVNDFSSNSDRVTLSIGGYITIPDFNEIEHLISMADNALYQSKGKGRNTYTILNGDKKNE